MDVDGAGAPRRRPLASIVIPCYNAGEYLRESVDAALAQTLAEKEVIVVDDGSYDQATLAVLQDLDRTGVRVLRQANQGPSAARNAGIEVAAGEYILPLDADDVIGHQYLEFGVEVLRSRPEIGIVYCRAEFFGTRHETWGLPDYSYPEILAGNSIFCSFVFRKSDWAAVGGYKPEMGEGWEDYEFAISLIETGLAVHRLPQTLFYYRYREGTRNQSLDIKKLVRCHERIVHNHPELYLKEIAALLAPYYRATEELEALKADVKRLERENLALAAFRRLSRARGSSRWRRICERAAAVCARNGIVRFRRASRGLLWTGRGATRGHYDEWRHRALAAAMTGGDRAARVEFIRLSLDTGGASSGHGVEATAVPWGGGDAMDIFARLRSVEAMRDEFVVVLPANTMVPRRRLSG